MAVFVLRVTRLVPLPGPILLEVFIFHGRQPAPGEQPGIHGRRTPNGDVAEDQKQRHDSEQKRAREHAGHYAIPKHGPRLSTGLAFVRGIERNNFLRFDLR